MDMTAIDERLLDALADGLPFVERPYAALGNMIGVGEAEAIARIRRLIEDDVISRFGIIVRHHSLGYNANGMVVWDVPDDRVAAVGRQMADCAGVTLCYRRPRRDPEFPYNLYCMIHGRDQRTVRDLTRQVAATCNLHDIRREILFSRSCFKQRGARYRLATKATV